jgi:hypothetical protein
MRAKHSIIGIPPKDWTNAWPLRIGYLITIPCLALSNGFLPRILEFCLAKKENVGAKHFIKYLENYGIVEMLCPSLEGIIVRILEFRLAWRAKHSMTGVPYKGSHECLAPTDCDLPYQIITA